MSGVVLSKLFLKAMKLRVLQNQQSSGLSLTQKYSTNFEGFLFQVMLPEFGSYEAVSRNMVMMCNTLQLVRGVSPYSKLLLRSIGMATPVQEYHETELVIYTNTFFTQCMGGQIDLNVQDGGSCSVFEVMVKLE